MGLIVVRFDERNSSAKLRRLQSTLEKTKLYFTNALNSQPSGPIRNAAKEGLKFSADTLSELSGITPLIADMNCGRRRCIG